MSPTKCESAARSRCVTCLTLFLLLGFVATNAAASTGVSDERVVLPDGPGSIGGVGENTEIDPNMGQMSYSVKIDLPEGYQGMTPSLGLAYSSGSGSSEVGIGWRLAIPYIERMSLWGLPEYLLERGAGIWGRTSELRKLKIEK